MKIHTEMINVWFCEKDGLFKHIQKVKHTNKHSKNKGYDFEKENLQLSVRVEALGILSSSVNHILNDILGFIRCHIW